MLSIAHATTGAFIASQLPDPLLATPLILATHYLEDAIPHWDAGTGLTSGKITPLRAIIQEIPDLALAGLAIILIFQLGHPLTYTTSGLAPYWGAIVALIPDFLEAPRNFLKWEPKWLGPINRFHHSFHHSIPRKADGLAPQLLLLVLILLTR